MKKVGLIIAVIVTGLGLSYFLQKKANPVMPATDPVAKAEIERQDAAYDQSKKTFDELSLKMAEKRRKLNALQDVSEDAKEVYEKLEEIRKEKTQILHGKPIKDGNVELSDDELERIAELDKQELEKQQRLLMYVNTLKEL